MAWNLVAHTFKKGTARSGTNTTPAIDTTGANLLVIVASHSTNNPTISDSKSNTYGNVVYSNAGVLGGRCSIWYIQPGTVGSSHTFSISGTNVYGSIFAMAFSGSASTPLDASNSGAAIEDLSFLTGSITPSLDGELIIAAGELYAEVGPLTVTADNSIIQPDAFISESTETYGCCAGYKVQASAAAINVTWSTTDYSDSAGIIASFKVQVAVATNLMGQAIM